MTARASSARGVTLVELLVSLLVASVVFVGVTAVVGVQQRAYTEGHRQRSAQTSARAALSFLEQKAAIAGFGMDAPLALDLDRYAGPCPDEMTPCARDRTDGSDELVFLARNPSYWTPEAYSVEPAGNAWRILAIGEGAVRVHVRKGQRFLKGQVLQAVCRAGRRYAYMTVGATTAEVTDAAGADVDVQLLSSVTGDPLRRQNAATDSCFIGGEARLFLIDRFRFHVRPVPVVGTQYDPYLMLDTGVDVNVDGAIDANDEIVVAEGIELMQVAYVLLDPTLPIRGMTAGTQVAFTQGTSGSTAGTGITTLSFPGTLQPGQFVYEPTSWYGYTVGPPPSTVRRNDHQANVRALRIALSSRSPTPATEGGASRTRTTFFNLNSLPTWLEASAPYERFTVETQIPLRNMLARGMNDF